MITSSWLDRKRLLLSKEMQRITQQLNDLPDGWIYFIRNGKRWKWKLRTRTPGGRRSSIIIKKSDLAYAQKLAARRYLEERLAGIQKLIQLIDQMIRAESELVSYPSDLHEESEDYRMLLDPLYKERQAQISAWKAAPYKSRTDRPEQHNCQAKCGILACSKSEAFIADMLTDFGIPFRYEPELVFGKIVLHPDFLILNPLTLEDVIWEHCGMMDSPKYVKTVFSRLELFYAAGFSFEKNNLIFTYEGKDHPLYVQQVQSIIEEYFLNM